MKIANTSTGASSEKQIEIETTSEAKNIEDQNINNILPEKMSKLIVEYSDDIKVKTGYSTQKKKTEIHT